MMYLKKEICTNPVDSILEAVLTVSPNKQYRGIFKPTTPATTIPVCTPNVELRQALIAVSNSYTNQIIWLKNHGLRIVLLMTQ